MADLKQSLLWLAEGKKIRSIDWEKNQYLYIDDDEIKTETDGERSELLLAVDWELYEDPDDLVCSELLELNLKVRSLENIITGMNARLNDLESLHI